MIHEEAEVKTTSYIRVLKRRKFLILQAVLLVPLIALFLSLRQGKLYAATAQVLLTYQNLAAGVTGTANYVGVLQQPDRLAQTQIILARVPTIFDRAIVRAGVRGRTAQELQDSSSVSVEANADILDFKVTDSSRSAAARLATAYASEYTNYKQAIDTASVVHARADVQKRLKDLRSAGQAGGPLYKDLQARAQQLATLESLETSNAYVIRSASGATQVRPKPLRITALGVLAGLFLGLVLAFVREKWDRRVHSLDELEDIVALPLLARLSEPSRRIMANSELATLEEPHSVASESFRVLRTTIELANLDLHARTILVTSAMHSEGKSPVAANLAVTLGRNGRRVVLVDLDLRRPSVATLFGVGHAVPGVTNVALGQATLEDALQQIAITTPGEPRTPSTTNGKGSVAGMVEILVSGSLPSDPGDFVGTPALEDILRALEERADFVIVDAPPIVGRIHDAMVLSTRVDAILAVARMGVITKSMAKELRRMLDQARAPKLGVVVIGAEVPGETQAYEAYYMPRETKSEALDPLRDHI